MTTAQLIIVCLTVLLLAAIVAVAQWLHRELQHHERLKLADPEALERAHAAEKRQEAVERELELHAATADVEPKRGAQVAVHFDGRVVQGTLDAIDHKTVLLSEAKVVTGSQMQALGGRQHIPRKLVTQVQEF